jgi:hypothetical protein
MYRSSVVDRVALGYLTFPLIINQPLLLAHLPLPLEVHNSPDQAAHYNIIGSSSLTWHLAVCRIRIISFKCNIYYEIVYEGKILRAYEMCFSLKGATRLIQGWRISKHICDPTLEKSHTCVNILAVVKHLVMPQIVPSIKIVPTLMRYVSYVIICSDKKANIKDKLHLLLL